MLAIRNIDRVVLRVRDINAMTRSYCDVFGAERVAYRPDFGMTHLGAGASMIDIVPVDDPFGKVAARRRDWEHQASFRRRGRCHGR